MHTTPIYGVVKDGGIVLQPGTSLPEGARVQILVKPPEADAQWFSEFVSWEAASDEAWALIEAWEKEQP